MVRTVTRWGLAALLASLGCADSRSRDGESTANAPVQGEAGARSRASRDVEPRDAGASVATDPAAAERDAGAADAAVREQPTPAEDAGNGCQCTLTACPENTQRVALPGKCCPVCQPCSMLDCAVPACGPGEEPLIPPGQCCPTGCAISEVDAGAYGAVMRGGAGTCERVERPVCNGNGWPHCAQDWQTALSDYARSCPGFGPYLARCDHHNAIVYTSVGVTRVFVFDRNTGRLLGFELLASDGQSLCEAYQDGFVSEVETCQPIEPGCSPDDLDGLEQPDAGVELPWPQGTLPSCEEGKAAYDGYLSAQLAEHNTCSAAYSCFEASGPGASVWLNNPCGHPCEFVLSSQAVNSQIIFRLDTFGATACALCPGTHQPECGFLPQNSVQCVDQHCAVVVP